MSPGVLEELASQLRALGDSQGVGWGHSVLPDPRRALLGHLGLRSKPSCAQPRQGSRGSLGSRGGRGVGIPPQAHFTLLAAKTALPQDHRAPALPRGPCAASQYSATLRGCLLLRGKALQHGCCFLGTALSAAPPTPCPLRAGLSAAGAILHLLTAALLLGAGLGRRQAPAQTRRACPAIALPRDCRQDPELPCSPQVPFSPLPTAAG